MTPQGRFEPLAFPPEHGIVPCRARLITGNDHQVTQAITAHLLNSQVDRTMKIGIFARGSNPATSMTGAMLPVAACVSRIILKRPNEAQKFKTLGRGRSADDLFESGTQQQFTGRSKLVGASAHLSHTVGDGAKLHVAIDSTEIRTR
jgi:hypothetical protein